MRATWFVKKGQKIKDMILSEKTFIQFLYYEWKARRTK